jgi:integrase
MKRENGLGTVTPLADGRFRARAARQQDGSRPSLGIYDTREAAERAVLIGLHALQQTKRVGVPTFESFALEVLDDRELSGMRSVPHDRNRFKVHLATAPFAHKPIDQVTTVDGAEWLRIMARKRAQDQRGDRLVSPDVAKRALSLANAIMHEAGPQGRGLIDRNPFIELKVKKRADEAATKEKWTFLTPDEQVKILHCEAIPDYERWVILFACGAGLRQGEQFNLELRDLFVEEDEAEPRAVIRFGSKGKPRKNGKTITVPLFGIALRAAREWLKILPTFCPHNFDRIVFPTENGHRRRSGKPLGNGNFRPAKDGTHVLISGKPKRARTGGTHRWVGRLPEVLALAGVTRRVRWHDMRHTCASTLLTEADWRLEEIKELLGHSSITVTQRYAHLGETALKKAAKRFVGPAGLEPATVGLKGPCATVAPRSPVGHVWPKKGSNLAEVQGSPVGLKGRDLAESLRVLTREKSRFGPAVTHLASALAALLETS